MGSLNHFTQKFRFEALFGRNDVLEIHVAPHLDQLSVLVQKKIVGRSL